MEGEGAVKRLVLKRIEWVLSQEEVTLVCSSLRFAQSTVDSEDGRGELESIARSLEKRWGEGTRL